VKPTNEPSARHGRIDTTITAKRKIGGGDEEGAKKTMVARMKRNTRRNEGGEEMIGITMTTKTNLAGQIGVPETAETATIGRGVTAITDAREIEGLLPIAIEIAADLMMRIPTTAPRDDETEVEIEGSIVIDAESMMITIEGGTEMRAGFPAATVKIAIAIDVHNPTTTTETIATIEAACHLLYLVCL